MVFSSSWWRAVSSSSSSSCASATSRRKKSGFPLSIWEDQGVQKLNLPMMLV